MAENKVQLDIFEGPLDLLLYLVKKEELDIYEVNLTKIATQFIEYIEVMRELDLEIAGEFLVMAATLMFIKSRELLPVDQQAAVEEEEEGDDPRWELVRRLVEYKKFKDAAARLQEKEAIQENVYPRTPGKLELDTTSPGAPSGVSVFDLINAVGNILKRIQKQEAATRDVFEDRWTVSDKIEQLMALTREKPRLKFSDLFEGQTSRLEVVTTFLALLELIRLKVLTALQAEPFSDIEIGTVAQALPVSNGSAPSSEGSVSAS